MSEQNKTLVRRLFEEVANHGDLSVIDELFAINFVDHNSLSGQESGTTGLKLAIADFRAMLPDLQVTIDDLIAEGDTVVSRESWRGIHTPSGKQVTGTVIHIFRFKDGKIMEEWSEGWDWLYQLSAVPPKD